jgi:hypothetical protein
MHAAVKNPLFAPRVAITSDGHFWANTWATFLSLFFVLVGVLG